MSKFPDWWLPVEDTNMYIKKMEKWEKMKFFPNVVDNERWWSLWFKFWDFHFSVELAWSPKPVIHDAFVDSWMSIEEADYLLNEFKKAMVAEKQVWTFWDKQLKRTAMKVIVRRVFDENDKT